MPALRTEITEIVTGLGMLGFDDLDDALRARPPQMRNVGAEHWERLGVAAADRRNRIDFAAAWQNGRAFAAAVDGLDGREPHVIEWRGSVRAPGDEVVPADLRVDHVYLVSCKYLSRILINASPQHLFDRALAGGHGLRAGDWYDEVAPDALQSLYDVVRAEVGRGLALPPFVRDLTSADRVVLRDAAAGGWSSGALGAYRAMSLAVARASAARWRAALRDKRARESMLWRLLRIGSAPYFVLGVSGGESLRVRVATPWDWRQLYDLRAFEVWGQETSQPTVGWSAVVRRKDDGADLGVGGHVEVRWSHGRFARPPEAKVYLDTPHRLVPGYLPLA